MGSHLISGKTWTDRSVEVVPVFAWLPPKRGNATEEPMAAGPKQIEWASLIRAAQIHRKGYFWQEFKGREMYGRKKLQKENEANLLRLADSNTTKKFEDEPAERKRLTALRHGKWKILYLIFRVKKRWEEEEVARKEKSRPHLAQFPRHWPAPMLGYWADLGKADNSPVTGAPALPCPS